MLQLFADTGRLNQLDEELIVPKGSYISAGMAQQTTRKGAMLRLRHGCSCGCRVFGCSKANLPSR